MLTTIVWDQSPELLQTGPFSLNWYGICFAMAFITALPIWYHMFAKAGKESIEAERLQRYITLGVILGARLGHVFFYDWDYFKHHLIQIFLPVVFFPKFKIVGFTGLASHGATIGIILAVFLYVKRIQISISPFRIHLKNRRPAGELLWIFDHLVILVALGGVFIRIGNFMNSEIIGKPTQGKYGVVFLRDIREDLYANHASMIEKVMGKVANSRPMPMPIKRNHQPIQLSISFKDTIQDEEMVKNFLQGSLKNSLVRMSHSPEAMIYEQYGTPLSYTLTKHNGGYQAIVYTFGIPRHPSQLYESFSCFLLFISLFLWWRKKGPVLAPGRMAGMFMVMLFTLRFFYEFYKENQVAFENSMWLNMGQLLSLPCIVGGLWLLLRTVPRSKEKASVHASGKGIITNKNVH
ncbi:prolipoprotein diacylglyceryl transferase [Candidatus Cardinium hertigii]|uniref:Phosphatidylglycerol--prolipoprotein diacylglyceryl transferase n=1 Tax=Candidatus Cardinium hertigii TaxID=247481 RepID=A0A3N2QD33_9BACT|nr:prolipoprotein diacylglyceryl transferase [Candidatus Cardinium hertigii]ROT47733.1 prolipoprotein diacylglyceryl transferase [Candidatus Cardinium hertigii]